MLIFGPYGSSLALNLIKLNPGKNISIIKARQVNIIYDLILLNLNCIINDIK
jgi:hypothetical protein